MANFTKKAIQESFLKLLNERPLSQITVKYIVTYCGINRNTFYYHFTDIQKLVEDLFVEEAERIIQAYPTIERFEDCLEALVDSALLQKRAVLHVYHSASRELYEMCLWKVCDHIMNAYVSSALIGRKVKEEDINIIRGYFSSLFYGILSGWLRTGMTEDLRRKFARMCEIQKGTIEQMISICEENKI